MSHSPTIAIRPTCMCKWIGNYSSQLKKKYSNGNQVLAVIQRERDGIISIPSLCRYLNTIENSLNNILCRSDGNGCQGYCAKVNTKMFGVFGIIRNSSTVYDPPI